MSNVYPLDVEPTYRKQDNSSLTAHGVSVAVSLEDENAPKYDPTTGTTQVELPDGQLTISFGPPAAEKKDVNFDSNLADELEESALSTISERLLLGIEQDIQSRSAWLENMSAGLDLLGLEIKQPRGAAAMGTTPAEGTSTVDHPLLLEAVLRFQANARGELLPSDGPVKIRNDGEGNTLATKLATALEKDLNHYLTKVAKEYYPDTDRMLLMLGFCGISFKKGYHDPIKRRPVVASIDAKDLIVSNAATDLEGAGRVTHRIMMRPSTLRRMQLVGAYRDIPLPSPDLNPVKNPVDAKVDQIQGIAPATSVDALDDQDRELFECYCEIEVPGFEHTMKEEGGKEVQTGLPLPYKIVLDRESRRILEIRRNWHEDDPFCLPRNRIIAYIFIPGLGFYGIGLLNVLGNATKAVTAAWRLMLDAGMFSNFPGFLYVKQLSKQLTNQFRIAPGSGMPIDTIGNDIRASVMPLPYKDPSAVFIQLIENIATTAQRVGGTAEQAIGEGKQDAPVGTTLALIEQATKLMSVVHKRLHQAQGQEFDMLRSLLMEDPEALWRHNKKSAVLRALIAETGQEPVAEELDKAEERHRKIFLTALDDLSLVPAADPNTASQTERYLKVMALRQMAQSNQSLDMNKVDEYALTIMGIDDPQSFFVPPQPNGAPPPEQLMAQATIMSAQAKLQDSQTKAKDLDIKAATAQATNQQRLAELGSRERIASLGVARELVVHSDKQDLARETLQNSNDQAERERAARAFEAAHGRAHTSKEKAVDRAQSGIESAQTRAAEVAHKLHDTRLRGAEMRHEAALQHMNAGHQFKLAQIKAEGVAAKQRAQAKKKD